MLHLDAQDILQYAERIARIKVPFVIDHMGPCASRSGTRSSSPFANCSI